MSDATIHGIEFEIKGNSDEAANSINTFVSTLRRLKSATSGGLGLKSVSKEFSVLGAAAKGIRGIVSAPFKKGWESVSKYAKGLGNVLSGFKRILGYRLIRTLIKEIGEAFSEGIKNVYGWSKAFGGPVNRAGMTFAQTMNDIATSLAYFKNSVGAAVAPLFNVLAPAIRAVTDAAVQLLNVINQLFARLTGQSSWTRATRQATEYGEAVGGAGGAAKEALKYLAPFDELNVLPDNNKGGGGGGGGDDYSGIFEEVTEFEQGIADFADRIRELINSGEWAQLGQLLGEKVNEIVNSIDWSALGTKVGQKINALFTTEYWTLKTINFQNIGAKVAEFLNSAIAEINFSNIGGVIAEKLTILPDLIIGAVNNLNFKNVGKSIHDVITGFFDNIGSWAQEVNWTEFGTNLVNGLIDLFDGLDTANILLSAFRMLDKVVGGLAEGIGAAFKAVGDAIKEYFQSNNLWTDVRNAFAEKWNSFANWANQFLPEKLQLPTAEIEVEAAVDPTVSNDGWNRWKQEIQSRSASDPASASTTANLNQFTNSLQNSNKPSIPTKANFNSYANGIGKPGFSSVANINSKTIASKLLEGNKMKISAVAKIDKAIVKPGLTVDVIGRVTRTTKASGGVYTGNGWRPITSYAKGGSPFGGQIFRARENGNPELVGTLRGSTAVMNNDQIVASVSDGVARAIAGIKFNLTGLPAAPTMYEEYDGESTEDAFYRAMVRALTDTDFGDVDINVDLDGQKIYNNVVSRNKKEIFRTGANPMTARA